VDDFIHGVGLGLCGQVYEALDPTAGGKYFTQVFRGN